MEHNLLILSIRGRVTEKMARDHSGPEAPSCSPLNYK